MCLIILQFLSYLRFHYEFGECVLEKKNVCLNISVVPSIFFCHFYDQDETVPPVSPSPSLHPFFPLLLSFPPLISKMPLISSVQFSHLVMSDSLRPHGLQHARLHCPSTPGTCSNSCPLSRWCHPTISSSVVPYMLGDVKNGSLIHDTSLLWC